MKAVVSLCEVGSAVGHGGIIYQIGRCVLKVVVVTTESLVFLMNLNQRTVRPNRCNV